MKQFGIFILVFFTAKLLGFSPVSYIVKPYLEDKQPTIEVELHMTSDQQGKAVLHYFNETWGEKDLYQCLRSFEVRNPGARLKIVREQNKIFIESLPNETLHIVYTLQQDFKGAPGKSQYYRPIINQTYFHLFGHRLFMIPDHIFKSNEAHDINISWLTENLKINHNFGLEPSGSYHLTRDELLESIIVGGDFRTALIKGDGIQIQLLTRGHWRNFDDHQLAAKLESIIEVQRTFWNDNTDSIFTVALLPLAEDGSNAIGGTGLIKGFASYCANTELSDVEHLVGLYYHEIMHHWLGGKVKSATRTEELWFSEGFTEYLSQKLMAEQGEISLKDFKKQKRLTHRLHRQSPYHLINNQDIALQSLSDENEIEKVPYRRGFLYALYLDQRLKESELGDTDLREMMQKILSDCKNEAFSNSYFKKLVGTFLGAEEEELFEQYIIKGALIDRGLLF